MRQRKYEISSKQDGSEPRKYWVSFYDGRKILGVPHRTMVSPFFDTKEEAEQCRQKILARKHKLPGV